MNEDRGDQDNLVTVRRTMAIFELLAAEARGYSLADIARHLDVNKSIAVRILNSLEQSHYVYRNNTSQRYFLTFKVCNLGLAVLVASRFMEQIQPRLRQLAEDSGELVLLSVIEADGPKWVMAANGSAGRRLQVDPLMNNVLHSTATGKAWLATLEDSDIVRRVGEIPPPVTPFTVKSADALLEQMRTIRAQGYAISDQENEVGIKAISLPIWTQIGQDGRRCVGFVSITAPISRADEAAFERFREQLSAAARYLGDVWPPGDVSAGASWSSSSTIYVIG